jgi:hypothetical protein
MKTIAIIAGSLLASACASYDGYNLRPGTSSESQVRQVMGQPALERVDAQGIRHLVYPRGPLGPHTYVADVGPDGTLRAMRQVLSDDVFNAIRPGMQRDEVLSLIGPPGDTMHFQLSNQTAWDYRYRDNWGYPAIFSVSFDADGIVVSKFSRRIERPDHGKG